jgi:hypothetical protein
MEEVMNSCRILVGKLKGRNPLKALGVIWRTTLRSVSKEQYLTVLYIHLGDASSHWQAVVSTAMNLRLLLNTEDFLSR